VIHQNVGVNIYWYDAMKRHTLVVPKPDALFVLAYENRFGEFSNARGESSTSSASRVMTLWRVGRRGDGSQLYDDLDASGILAGT